MKPTTWGPRLRGTDDATTSGRRLRGGTANAFPTQRAKASAEPGSSVVSPHTSARVKSIQVGPTQISYVDAGSGSPVILAHCSSASNREWSRLVPMLAYRHRVLAPDLIGYGRSDPWPHMLPFDPLAEVNVILRLAELAGEPVHLVGHSYGGAVALEAGRQLGKRVRSLTLIEPVAFHLLRQVGRAEWNEVLSVAERIWRAVASRRDEVAARVYMSYWIGALRWWLMPRRRKAGIVATVGKVAQEFGIISQLDVPYLEYGRIDTPTRLIAGSRTRASARAVVEVLRDAMPDAELHIVPGAGHMSPFTHADAISALVMEHIRRHTPRPPTTGR